jgi:hypothetical protein
MTESSLSPPQEYRQRIDDVLTTSLAEAHDRVVQGSVVPTFDVARFRDELAGFNRSTRGWTTLNEPRVGVLCIVPPKWDAVRPIVNHVVAFGKAWVSIILTEGREAIRACVTSGMTTAEDISDLAAALLWADETFHRQEQ